jgi:hypothetical protein
MTHLTIDDLQQMGVEVAGYPKPTQNAKVSPDSVYLSPAVVIADITLDNGAIIPAGTVAVTVSELNLAAPTFEGMFSSVCFFQSEPEKLPKGAIVIATSAIIYLAKRLQVREFARVR